MKGFSQKVFVSFALTITTLSAAAAPRMARVVEVRDSRTIVVQSGQQRIDITLAGVAPLDRVRSVDFLRWTLGQSWVMLEESPEQPGAHLVYRSPDGLFINREYVLRGFADPTLPGITPDSQTQVTYLGELNPGQRRATEVAKGDRSKRAAPARKSGSAAPKSGPPTTTPRTTTRTARSRS
jgi:hypothetical protein